MLKNNLIARIISGVVAAALLLCAYTLPASAQTYPSKPIHLVVPYGPGMLTDLLARGIGERLTAALKQPVVIENRPGAGSLVGAEAVAKSPADGYTLLLVTSATLGISPALYRKSLIDPVKDFAPVAQVGTTTFFLVTAPSFPVKNMKEMIVRVKANPGKFNYASSGNGTPHHLFMELLKKAAGLDVQHITYKGTLQALPALLTGEVQLMFADATVAIPNIQSGRVVALGGSSAKPTTLIAGVPPIADSVPGYDWQSWAGVVAPAGTPPAILATLSAEFQRMQGTPDFRALLVKFGLDSSPPNTPEQFAAFVKSEVKRWAKVVADTGAVVD